jgi:hypothetical protein
MGLVEMELKVVIVGQDEDRVHFVLLDEDNNIVFDNPDFSKIELLELVTEGNYDVVDEEEDDTFDLEEELI